MLPAFQEWFGDTWGCSETRGAQGEGVRGGQGGSQAFQRGQGPSRKWEMGGEVAALPPSSYTRENPCSPVESSR